jgi:hypothetical protein
MARAGAASLARYGPGELPPLDLDGTAVQIVPPRKPRDARLNDIHTQAIEAALATGDQVALGLLREARLDAFADALGLFPDNPTLLEARGLQAMARGDRAEAVTLLETALADATARAARTTYPGLSDYLLAQQVPGLELALASLGAGQAGFDATLRRALVAHRMWWATCQANPGIPQDLDPQGFLAIAPLCFAALRHASGQPVGITSEYLPVTAIR